MMRSGSVIADVKDRLRETNTCKGSLAMMYTRLALNSGFDYLRQ